MKAAMLLACLVLALLCGFGGTFWRGAANPSPAGAAWSGASSLHTHTALAQPGDIAKTITATGTLSASLNVDVGSQLSGQIARLLVDFNDSVVKGQPLAELDQSAYLARRDEVRAALASAQDGVGIAEAHLRRARADASAAEWQKAVMAARVDLARVHHDTAIRESQRKTILIQRGAASESDSLDAAARRDAAAAALREAEASFAAQAAASDGGDADRQRAEAELAAARHLVDHAEAELASAQVDLDRSVIRAPIDGLIIGRNVSQGQTLVSALQTRTLFEIAGDLRHMEVYARVDESDIGKIAVGQSAVYTVDAFPGRSFPASVRQIRKAPQIVQNIVTYVVVLSAENPDNILLPGMTALAKIAVSKHAHPITIPLAALRFNPDQDALAPARKTADGRAPIWIVAADGQIRRILVKTGEDDGERVAIRSGDLHAGDKVVVGASETPNPLELSQRQGGL